MTLKPRFSSLLRYWAKPAISLFAILVSLLIGEVLVRALGTAPEVKAIQLQGESCVYKRSTNPILGFELRANYTNDNPDFIVDHTAILLYEVSLVASKG